MTDLQELYQSVILDHNRNPRNHGTMENATASAELRNPICGDHVEVSVLLEDDHLTDIRFTGKGCAISQASASLMTMAVRGRSKAEAEELFEKFHSLVTGKTPDVEITRERLGQLVVFSGVSRFPGRVKCAALAWHTLKAALSSSSNSAGSELEE